MFVNQLNTESDVDNFLLYAQGININSFEIMKNKFVMSGDIGFDNEFLTSNKVIARVIFTESLPTNKEVLEPELFSYKDLNASIDGFDIYQKVILKPNFRIEIPYKVSSLNNLKIFVSFIVSIDDTNIINYYSKSISYVVSSQLLLNSEVSDKTILSILFEDEYLIEQTYPPQYEQETYLSEIYHTLDNRNNFYATVFYNLENLLKDKLYFRNLINYPDFVSYLRDNFLVSIRSSLNKGENTIGLDTQIQNDIYLDNNLKNNSLIMTSPNMDVVKYDGGFINIDVNYNESSVAYIQNVIIPFIDNLQIQAGIVANSAIDLLMFYKLIKEFSSSPNSLSDLLSFRTTNTSMPINNDNVERIKQIASYTKFKFVQMISSVSAENIANTKITLRPKQQINLYNTNAGIDFINLSSTTENNIVYPLNSFRNIFEQEVSRFFPDNSVTANGVSFDVNTLPISFTPYTIRLFGEEQITNEINFSNYLTTQITDEEKTNFSANFAKIVSFFGLNRDNFKVNSYSFSDLLDKDLNYKNLTFIEVPREKASTSLEASTFSIIQKDNVISYNSFPSSLRNEVCLDFVQNEESSQDLTNNVRNREIPENLFNNLVTNSTFVNSNLYANNYKNVSLTTPSPVQVIYPYKQFLERTNTLFQETEPVVADGKLFSLFYTNFKIIGKVEYLSLLNDGMYSIWNTLNLSSLQISSTQRIFCRVSFYYDGENKITEQNFDAFSIYSKYFYIEAQ